MFENVNEVAILVSSILSIAIASIWYSPLLFGEQWMRAAGLDAQDLEVSGEKLVSRVVLGILANFVFFYVLAEFVAQSNQSGTPLMYIAGLLTLFLCAFMVSSVIWEKRSPWYTVIHIGYAAVIIFGGLAVIAYWPW